ncbi:hypothetical protein TTHERM_00157960 (macronuclear) [Tetrahymena thermophila SB210]|uniref:Uncharacterized protein n=1 Tax=Tetrahymena thermophila (strain SB210) TaxID=312017 RepID=Q22WD8_TETTS|nr:hypothetical protein TTHERM_00157960 [Tetrahymena thermophila SB210]EAR89479.1 hypothetical protein TTHERM_00157960 [Tetrahymena thermophila SB210]|eukprot:XP_001009724.1 hypothetical protein TTHERM_00157960 [Tetrahymena thermophila SB210]
MKDKTTKAKQHDKLPQKQKAIKKQDSKPNCHKCKSDAQVVDVVYGKPAKVLIDQANRKEVFLAGCKVDKIRKNWYCYSCEHKFNSKSK